MQRSRAQLEEIEQHTLAPFASLSVQSRGRVFVETESDARTAFMRDRDRVVHSAAFRRLAYKTQVFVNSEGDHYRSRLTHSLEVAQVARSIARALGANEDLCETIALAHDLGHPPFGHGGERALATLMRDHGSHSTTNYSFNHNRQSYRVVTLLEQPYKDFDGLNLTWESLEGIAKHDPKHQLPEAKNYEPFLRPSLEAQIAGLADETAYSAHDLDDGLRSGIISGQDVMEVELLRDLMKTFSLRPNLDDLSRRILVRELLSQLVQDIVKTSAKNLEQHNPTSLAELRHLPHLLTHSEEMLSKLQPLKQFLTFRFYRHPRLQEQVRSAEMVVAGLFGVFKAKPELLPQSVHQHLDSRGLERSICDYLAGMTDRFAKDEHARLLNELRA